MENEVVHPVWGGVIIYDIWLSDTLSSFLNGHLVWEV